MTRHLFALFLLISFVAVNVTAADRVSPREQAVIDLHDLQSPLTTERQRALLSLQMLTDQAVATELTVADKVKAIVLDPNEPNTLIRCYALQTLLALQRNSIVLPNMMEMLNDLLLPANAQTQKNPKGYPFQLRLEALKLLINVANQTPISTGPNPVTDKVFLILKNLLANKKDLPDAMVAGVYRCLGAYSSRADARELLMEGLQRETSIEVLDAVLWGLRNGIVNNATTDRKLAELLSERFMRASDPKDKSIRVSLLDCLEGIISNITRSGGVLGSSGAYKPTSQLLDAVQNMLKTGDDRDVVAAVHFLMRVSAQDAKIAQLLLSVAAPSQTHPLAYQTLATINRALIDVLIGMGGNSKKVPESAVVAVANTIVEHIIQMLNPAETNNVPMELRRSMILGLAGVPTVFDRVATVDTLIKLLDIEAKREKLDQGMIGDIENALSFLTGVTPYRNVIFKVKEDKGKIDTASVNGPSLERIDMPDIALWQKWFVENQKKLAPGKTPFEER